MLQKSVDHQLITFFFNRVSYIVDGYPDFWTINRILCTLCITIQRSLHECQVYLSRFARLICPVFIVGGSMEPSFFIWVDSVQWSKHWVPCKPRLCFEVSFYIIFPRVQGWTHHCRRRSWWENIGMACCYGLVSHRLLADFMGLEKAGFAAVEVTIIPT